MGQGGMILIYDVHHGTDADETHHNKTKNAIRNNNFQNYTGCFNKDEMVKTFGGITFR